jgi:hypothetical protein
MNMTEYDYWKLFSRMAQGYAGETVCSDAVTAGLNFFDPEPLKDMAFRGRFC